MLSSAAAMGMGGGYHHQQQQQRGAAVFTAAQWAELEQQALIYKYLMAGVPVPPDLLLPIRPHSAAAAAFSFANPAASPFYHHHHPSSKRPPFPPTFTLLAEMDLPVALLGICFLSRGFCFSPLLLGEGAFVLSGIHLLVL